MTMTYKRTEWGVDPRWMRTEALDDHGESLGKIYFEPNPDFQPVATGTEHQRAPAHCSGWKVQLGNCMTACRARFLALRLALSRDARPENACIVNDS